MALNREDLILRDFEYDAFFGFGNLHMARGFMHLYCVWRSERLHVSLSDLGATLYPN